MKRILYVLAIISFILSGLTFALHRTKQTDVIANYQNTFQCHPAEVFDPATNEEVQAIVQRAIAEERKIMTGNRKFASQIDAACAPEGEFQITLKNMNKIVHFNSDTQKITVQAGMRFNQFNEFIRSQSLAVNMVTELGTFTIGGMLGSGTHGSTLQKQSNMIADYVTSIKLVDGLGDIRTLTGDALDAARVNLGVLGIVVEVTIQLEPAFKVQAKVDSYENDHHLEQVILDIARQNYSANIAWFPGIGKYTVTTYNPVPLHLPGDAYNAQADVSDFQEYMYGLLFNALHEFPGSGLQCLAAKVRYQARATSYFRDSESRQVLDNPIGYSDKMQYFTCKQPDQCIWDRLPIALQEVAIAMEKLPDWIVQAKALLAKHPKTCFPLNGIYFRFGKASPSYLGMNAGRDSAYIGIEYSLRQRGQAVPKNYFVNLELEQMTIREFEGRPHWGKNSLAIFEQVKSKYPKWQDFVQTKQLLDPHNIFTNSFWQRANEEESLADYLTPGCNTNGQCYCQTDAHCEQGSACVQGRYYQNAKICLKQ